MNLKSDSSSSLWVTIICGIALLSDGYVNNSIGSVLELLKKQYPDEAQSTNIFSYIPSVAFLGVIIGQLSFGWISDRFGRKAGMVSATALLLFGTLLCTFAYGFGSVNGLFVFLLVGRFILGIGIGAEYPTGSVAASETAGKTSKASRSALFIAVTNCAIDLGFVLSGLVAYLLVVLFPNKLELVWRLTIGIGGIIPLVLLFQRMRLEEPETYRNNAIKSAIPLSLIVKKYGKKLFAVSIIWFIYDFSSYAFSLYASAITERILSPGSSLAEELGWSTLILAFYLPGAFLGAFASDYFGPRRTLLYGILIQALFGFAMSIFFSQLSKSIGVFSLIYGLFLSFGEFGPGNNIGLLAASSCPTTIRGSFYGIAAASGKVGAFVGTFLFKMMIDAFGNVTGPFMIASSLNILAAIVCLTMIDEVTPDCVEIEDKKFADYLANDSPI